MMEILSSIVSAGIEKGGCEMTMGEFGKQLDSLDLSDAGIDGLSALALAQKMLEQDPKNELLQRAVAILSEEPADSGVCEKEAVASAEAALQRHPDNEILKDALALLRSDSKQG